MTGSSELLRFSKIFEEYLIPINLVAAQCAYVSSLKKKIVVIMILNTESENSSEYVHVKI